MLEFIKMFGLGIIYTLVFPVLVVIFSGFVVFTFINYLVKEVVNFFGFFMGYSFTVETELEQQLEKMREEKSHRNAENDVVGSGDFEAFIMQEDVTEDFGGGDQHE